MTKYGNTLRWALALVIALAIAGLFFRFTQDFRMSLFVFLVTAFAGSMFTMISIVTREN